ncbi:hypothetical protein [Paenibacillus senegalensis]|uniref:hypothetical protein n=1 Tax=Paenibacillus senegalensis TaxID=1465766 RepID=UPI00028819D5|nr:hypothetical protein [Paenibacillus senegalensis]
MSKWLLLSGVILLLAACGREKPDVSIFILPEAGLQADRAEVLQTTLQEELGETPTIAVHTSPIFDPQKLMVEVAAGDHGIIIISEDQFQLYAKNGGLMPLEEHFDPEVYPEGVLEVELLEEEGKTDFLLVGIPLAEGAWLQSISYKGQEMFAFIHPRAPDLEQSIEVLKRIVNME